MEERKPCPYCSDKLRRRWVYHTEPCKKAPVFTGVDFSDKKDETVKFLIKQLANDVTISLLNKNERITNET